MAEPAIKADGAQGEPVSGPVLDRDHLARMTLGDGDLEREVLGLFDRQAVLLLDRMAMADPAALAALAHTMKGSALGIGAMRVAQAAAIVERMRGADAIGRLKAEVADARVAIAAVLGAV